MTVHRLLVVLSSIAMVGSFTAMQKAPASAKAPVLSARGQGYICGGPTLCSGNTATCEAFSWLWYTRSQKKYSNPGQGCVPSSGNSSETCNTNNVWCSYVKYFYDANCNNLKDEYIDSTANLCSGGANPVPPAG